MNLELLAIPCAILNDTTAQELVSAHNDVQALADITDAADADPKSGLDDVPNCLLQPSLRQHYPLRWLSG